MKIHTGDTVVVLSGKDKGKTGQVLRVLPSKGRVVVAGANMRTRHMKKTPQRAGQRIRFEASLDQSNVMIVDPKTKKRGRIGIRMTDGKRERYVKQSGEALVSGRKLKKLAEEATKEATKDTKDKKDKKDSPEKS